MNSPRRRTPLFRFAVFFLVVALLPAWNGCYGSHRADTGRAPARTAEPPADVPVGDESPGAAPVAPSAAGEPSAPEPSVPPADNAVAPSAKEEAPAAPPAGVVGGEEKPAGAEAPGAVPPEAAEAPSAPETKPEVPADVVRKGKPPVPAAQARPTPRLPVPGEDPPWVRGREELVFRIEFLGITMGYARFNYRGKEMVDGRETYHLSVRAWTSGILSVLYPVNETIDYYLDVRNLHPLRQEYTSKVKEKNDVATYDQDKGTVTYRYKHNGEIHKKVEAVPDLYDPVTAAYYFRARDIGGEERPRNVYAGRKVWQISARLLGVERIKRGQGEMETLVIQPIIRRDGKVENKGDLRLWMTNDERRVPVRVYAKFKKVRTWTLVGELVPNAEGG